MMCSPTSWLPVKLILRIRESPANASPMTLPEPVMQAIASGGSPASSRISTSASDDSGVSLAGLSTTELPAASAGPTLWHGRFSGKLNGVMQATTPQGTRSVKPNFLAPWLAASSGSTSPVIRLASSAESSIVSAARDASTSDSPRIFPSSLLMIRAKLLAAIVHQPSGLGEDPIAFVGRHGPHDLGPFDGPGHRGINVGRIGLGNRVDDRMVERTANFNLLRLIDPLTADEHFHGNQGLG